MTLTCNTVQSHTHSPDDTITLDETARHRRRMLMRSDTGIAFLLDLPTARLLRHGEGLLLSDGRIIEVRAVPEALMEVRGRDAQHLVTLGWQIGNRHLPAQIKKDCILIRRDHIIRDMLLGLGATIAEVTAPFDPEGGAYGEAHQHHHHDRADHHHD